MVMTPSVFAKYMQDDIAKWAHVIKTANIKATAGIHVMKVIRELGVEAELATRLRPFPNGAAAMKADVAALRRECGFEV